MPICPSSLKVPSQVCICSFIFKFFRNCFSNTSPNILYGNERRRKSKRKEERCCPSKTKKKKSKETTEVSKDTAASTEVDKMRTKYTVEKRGKKKNA